VQIYGRYPFDVKDKQYPQKFQHAIYLLPPEIPASDACKDLLTRLLVADPDKRISLGNILSHPWFLETLPSGALTMNDHYLQKTPNLTRDVRPCQSKLPCRQEYLKSYNVCKASMDLVNAASP